jgi:uncharacterized Zn finger protein
MKFPCPLCKKLETVLMNKKSKPYFRCEDCGVLMFINKQPGIKKIKAFESSETKGKTSESNYDWLDEFLGDEREKKAEKLSSLFDRK